jgi:hypothetical protein
MDKDTKTGKMVVTALGSIIKIHKKKGKSKQYEIQWDDEEYEILSLVMHESSRCWCPYS